MSESLSTPRGFESGTIVAQGEIQDFSVLPHELYRQAFPEPGSMVGIVDDEKFAGKSLLFVSNILSGKYDSDLGRSPQEIALSQFVESSQNQ